MITQEKPTIISTSYSNIALGENYSTVIDLELDPPESFFQALEDFNKGRVVDLDQALTDVPNGE